MQLKFGDTFSINRIGAYGRLSESITRKEIPCPECKKKDKIHISNTQIKTDGIRVFCRRCNKYYIAKLKPGSISWLDYYFVVSDGEPVIKAKQEKLFS